MPRSHLIEHLNTGISEKLTLISAPAGFGKSSLAREWVLALDRPVAWLSLDAGDNDLTRFFAYLIAALQQINSAIGQSIQSILGSPDPPSAVFGNPSQALELGRLAAELLPEDDPLSSGCIREFANLHWLFGYIYRLLRDPGRATDSLTEAVRLGKAAGDLWHTMLAMTELGMIFRHQGRMGEAADTFQEILEYADGRGVRSHGYLGRVEANLSLVLLDQNKLDVQQDTGLECRRIVHCGDSGVRRLSLGYASSLYRHRRQEHGHPFAL